MTAVPPFDERTGLDARSLAHGISSHLRYTIGRLPETASVRDWYHALAFAVRDRLQERWTRTTRAYTHTGAKTACYLSAEFLLGPHLGNNLVNLGIEHAAAEAVEMLGLDLSALLDEEQEPGLGNGGLGRLAACYLDAAATLERPLIGYGIRYEFGIFDQQLRDGWQVEVTDKWLNHGNPWEIPKPEISYRVNLGGHVEHVIDAQGRRHVTWTPQRVVKGNAFDTPIQGYGVNTCNTLRLWSAQAVEAFDVEAFNAGDYYRAVEAKVASETVSKVLYPNDELASGKRLRLIQQYFFVSCSLQDMLRILGLFGDSIERFADRFAVQLNDTHPSIAVAELMRLLLDEHGFSWDAAWDVTVRSMGYTNHTLLPEALETWPLPLFRELLPRHLEIIFEINERLLAEVRARFPGDDARVERMSLIGEHGNKTVRMAHLAAVGSHAINGVAALHSALLESSVLRDFHQLWPERFSNKTNGVTPRRFLALANPGLRELLDGTLGTRWVSHLDDLRQLEPLADDPGFRERWHAAKLANKQRLARYVRDVTGVQLDPAWLFDVQVKRIHEYKRQHLAALHIATLYHRLKTNPGLDVPPRAFIFGGKAAPGYVMAKRMIRLITGLSEIINADHDVNDRLRVVFIADFNVKSGQLIYPAADVSEQISTAGKEASGTGNMKFALNGALTVGTLDGANVEIREEVGDDNFFLFGMTVADIEELKRVGYRPWTIVEQNAELRDVLALVDSGLFARGDSELFRPLVENLRQFDPFFVLADYAAYVTCHQRVGETWRDAHRWQRMSILNTARSGKFSADRAVRQYCDEIWHVPAMPISSASADRRGRKVSVTAP